MPLLPAPPGLLSAKPLSTAAQRSRSVNTLRSSRRSAAAHHRALARPWAAARVVAARMTECSAAIRMIAIPIMRMTPDLHLAAASGRCAEKAGSSSNGVRGRAGAGSQIEWLAWDPEWDLDLASVPTPYRYGPSASGEPLDGHPKIRPSLPIIVYCMPGGCPPGASSALARRPTVTFLGMTGCDTLPPRTYSGGSIGSAAWRELATFTSAGARGCTLHMQRAAACY